MSIKIDKNGITVFNRTASLPRFVSPVFTTCCWNIDSYEDAEIERYIINDGATIIFWDDDTKTISKRHKEDKFDKELGFLFAYFYKKWGDNKSAKKRIIDSIDYKKIKIFLFEFYVKDSGKTTEQAKKYLSSLKVEK